MIIRIVRTMSVMIYYNLSHWVLEPVMQFQLLFHDMDLHIAVIKGDISFFQIVNGFGWRVVFMSSHFAVWLRVVIDLFSKIVFLCFIR